MKKTLLATIIVVVLAHIVFFGAVAIRGGEVNGEPSPQETTDQAAYDEPRTEPPVPLEPPSDASEVLDRYAATQDRIYAAFHIKIESTSEASYSDGRRDANSASYELLTDGRRFLTTREVRKDGSLFTHSTWLWDGQTFFSYSPTHMQIRREASELDKSVYTKLEDWGLRGYLGSYKWRIDELLRQAHEVSLRDSTELGGGALCYVIDAAFSYGKYSVWFDPAHGYNIARAVYEKGLGHPLSDGRVSPYATHVSMWNVQFKEVEGMWVPVAAKTQARVENPDLGTLTTTTQYRRTHVDLNPAFPDDAFVPDCPDGAVVRIDWIHDRSARFQTGYTWKNGQVLDPRGRVVKLTP